MPIIEYKLPCRANMSTKKSWRERLVDNLKDLLADFLIVTVLLAFMWAIGTLVHFGAFSVKFKAIFESVHEAVVLANYVVIGIKGLYRIMFPSAS